MKRILILSTLVAGCIDEDANIGISSEPVTCQPTAAGEAHGKIGNFTFGTATVQLQPAQPVRLSIADNQLILGMNFQCGQPSRDTYAVMPVSRQVIDCPLAVSGAITGQLEFADVSNGTLIVDETANCLAGRFAVHVDATTGTSGGSLSGWFSVPWQ
jgi:hypothetical protein